MSLGRTLALTQDTGEKNLCGSRAGTNTDKRHRSRMKKTPGSPRDSSIIKTLGSLAVILCELCVLICHNIPNVYNKYIPKTCGNAEVGGRGEPSSFKSRRLREREVRMKQCTKKIGCRPHCLPGSLSALCTLRRQNACASAGSSLTMSLTCTCCMHIWHTPSV